MSQYTPSCRLVAKLDEVRDMVVQDAEAALKRSVLNEATAETIDAYDIRIEYPDTPAKTQ